VFYAVTYNMTQITWSTKFLGLGWRAIGMEEIDVYTTIVLSEMEKLRWRLYPVSDDQESR